MAMNGIADQIARITALLEKSSKQGRTTTVVGNLRRDRVVDRPIDCRGCNALLLEIDINGQDASATISVQGASNEGGPWRELTRPLRDNARPMACKRLVKSGDIMDVPIPTNWARVRVSDLHGTFGTGQGVTILATPYNSSGILPFVDAWIAREILPATTISADDAGTNGAESGSFAGYDDLCAILTVSDKSLSAGTVDIYLQTSFDGILWDDIAHFTQITSAAIPNGSYIAKVANPRVSVADRPLRDGTLAANEVEDYFGARLRAKRVAASFGSDDTVTVELRVVAIGR